MYSKHEATSMNWKIGIEGGLKKLFRQFDEDLQGQYSSMASHTPTTENSLFVDHLQHNERLQNLKNADMTNHWPIGRGLFKNEQNTFHVFVNCEDHMRLVSVEPGSDIGRVWQRLNRGLGKFGGQMFKRNERLGYLTSSPANLGSTVRASVMIRLPKLSATNNVETISAGLTLEARKIDTPEESECLHIIRNKSVLGITEGGAVRQMYDGVKEILKMERELA